MHKFAPKNFERLENPDRYELLQPAQTLRQFGLSKGMTFLDIGAGTGFFSRSASEIVGEKGTVCALDISLEMLDIFRELGVPANVRLIKSEEFTFPLDARLADMTLLAFVLHESTDSSQFLAEAIRVTRSGGRIVILEWKKQDEVHGPPKSERLSEEEIRTFLRPYTLLQQGDLNLSHYYCIIQVE